MRWEPLSYRFKQSVSASPPYTVLFPAVQPGQRVRLRWFAGGMSGASTYTAQPVIINAGGTYQVSATISANNANVTGVLCDLWLNELDTFGFNFLTNNTAGTFTFVMSGELWTAEYALPPALQK
jgi:hypothetical protein